MRSEDRWMLVIIGITLFTSLAYAEVLWSDLSRVDFSTSSSSPQCIDGEEWKTWDPVIGDFSYSPSENDCYRADGQPSSGCCEYGIATCNRASNKCEGSAVDYCSNYTTAEDCSNDDFSVGVATIEEQAGFGTGFCTSIIPERIDGENCDWFIGNCRCFWNSTESKCDAVYNKGGPVCYNGTDDIPDVGMCIVSMVEKIDECETTGYITYRSRSQWWGALPTDPTEPGPETCISPPPISFRCGTKLPFFTLQNLVISIITITGIYLLQDLYSTKRGK